MTILEQVSHETMVFMRGKYRLDEIGDGKDELKFKQGSRTIVTIYIREDRFFSERRNGNALTHADRNFLHISSLFTTNRPPIMTGNGCPSTWYLWSSWRRSKSSY